MIENFKQNFTEGKLEYLDHRLKEKLGIDKKAQDVVRQQKALQPDYLPATRA